MDFEKCEKKRKLKAVMLASQCDDAVTAAIKFIMMQLEDCVPEITY